MNKTGSGLFVPLHDHGPCGPSVARGLIALSAPVLQADVLEGCICPECVDQLAAAEGSCAARATKVDTFISAEVGGFDMHSSFRPQWPGPVGQNKRGIRALISAWRTRGI